METLTNRLTPVLVVVLASLQGFAPTADLVTRAASRVIVLEVKDEACPRLESLAGGEIPATAGCCGSGVTPSEASRCQPDAADLAGRCDADPGARSCCRCFAVGGLLLSAVDQPSHDPDLRLLGRIAPRDPSSILRDLIPPVPPPIGDQRLIGV